MISGSKEGAGKLIDLVKDDNVRKSLHGVKDAFFNGANAGL